MTNTRNTTNNNMTDQCEHDQLEDQYYNYYIAHVAGRSPKVLSPEDGERIKHAYWDNVSETMTGAVANMITNAYNKGMTVDEIVMAIEETGFAPHPSPAYLRKILETWAEVGVTTSKIKHMCGPNRALPWWK